MGTNGNGSLGIGKLAAEFLPFTFASDPVWNEKIYALIIVGMTAIYVIKGGMYSVVLTEVLQFAIMTVACIGIAVIAMNATTAEQIAQATPAGWASFDFS